MNWHLHAKIKYLTSPLRRKPDYLIIGAQKSGTSTLFRMLSGHPAIRNPKTKEVHYFDWHYSRSFSWYKSQFPINTGFITGEATPIYLFHPDIPARVFKKLSSCKFIVILRNPVYRAHSHYQMAVRKKIESLPFEEAIKAEPSRISQALDLMYESNANYSLSLQRYSYLSRGIYVEQIARWFKLFPRSNFHILAFEDLISQPQEEYDKICAFLNLPRNNYRNMPKLNSDSYLDLNNSMKTQLQEYFAPYNEKLFALINQNFPWQE